MKPGHHLIDIVALIALAEEDLRRDEESARQKLAARRNGKGRSRAAQRRLMRRFWPADESP